MSFGTIVSRSQVTLEIFISCKLLPSQTSNSRRSRPGRGSVAYRSQSITGQSEVASVSRRSGRGCDSGARVYADRLTNGCEGRELASLPWCDRKSLLLLGQLYTFCLLVCQSLPNIDVNASLRSNDKSLTTAHVSKKSFSTRKSVLSWSRFGVDLPLLRRVIITEHVVAWTKLQTT